VIFNVIITTISLSFYSFFAVKKWGWKGLLTTMIIGLSPLFVETAMHPGNGFTYLYFVFLSLTILWFELPIFLSSLFLGIAISFHPAAIFALGPLLYEWWQRDKKILNLCIIGSFLLLPWAPIILFEIITKGQILKSFIETQDSYSIFASGLKNIQEIASYVGIPIIPAFLIWIYTGFTKNSRNLFWFMFSTILMVVLLFIVPLRSYYLLGVTCIVLFTGVNILIQKKIGVIILGVLVIYLLISRVIFTPSITKPTRTISKIENIASYFERNSKINKSKKIAVLAVLNSGGLVPHADDYRFFLRIKGFNVVDSQAGDTAEYLIMFVEVPDFDWQHWSTWDTDQFGSKEIVSVMNKNDIKIVIFKKTGK